MNIPLLDLIEAEIRSNRRRKIARTEVDNDDLEQIIITLRIAQLVVEFYDKPRVRVKAQTVAHADNVARADPSQR